MLRLRKMKLAQFKPKNANQPRVGVLLGDVVCDVAELARAQRSGGATVADWLLEAKSTLDVIYRGSGRCRTVGGTRDSSDRLASAYSWFQRSRH